VPDSKDDCPETPVNAEVDENGCELDTDSDGIPDSVDVCDDVPAGDNDADHDGCPDSDPAGDDDDDGVLNANDVCPNTPGTEDADEQGCSPGQSPPVCGNGSVEIGEQCDDGNTAGGDGCSASCQNEGGGGGPVCGNGAVDTGEQCDDGNTTTGDGCSATCQTEDSGIANDNCANPTAIGEGAQLYSNFGATTDGPLELEDCNFSGRSDIQSDLWFCYTATCTAPSVISLCGSSYDTKMAVYSGCACPAPEGSADRPLACSDDDCGSDIDNGCGVGNNQSRVTINATAGQKYLVRVGGFFGSEEQGDGRLTIRCGQDTCVNGVGDCLTHSEGQPGCATPSCCNVCHRHLLLRRDLGFLLRQRRLDSAARRAFQHATPKPAHAMPPALMLVATIRNVATEFAIPIPSAALLSGTINASMSPI
jgi:cysteine-rich repeat protein